MQKSEIKIGKTYWANVSGEKVPVRIEKEGKNFPHGGWVGRNVKTGREVRIKTAGRLHGEVPAKELKKSSQSAVPNRRNKSKPIDLPWTEGPEKSPKTNHSPKSQKDERRAAALAAIAKVLTTDPKKAKTIGEIHAALKKAKTRDCPSHGAIFYALKSDIEQHKSTRFVKKGSTYHLKKR